VSFRDKLGLGEECAFAVMSHITPETKMFRVHFSFIFVADAIG